VNPSSLTVLIIMPRRRNPHRACRLTSPIIPPELWSEIACHLPSRSIPAFRLISRQHASAGARFLVPYLYLSLNPLDLKRLSEVADHPIIRLSVTELRYDCTGYGEIKSKEEYLKAFNIVRTTSSRASLERGYEQYCRNAEARQTAMERRDSQEDWIYHVPAYCEHDPGWHANIPDDLTTLLYALQRLPKLSNMCLTERRYENNPTTQGWLSRASYTHHTMVYGPESLNMLTLDPTLMLQHHYGDEAPYTVDNVQRVYRGLFIMTQALSFVPQQTLTSFTTNMSVESSHDGRRGGVPHLLFSMSSPQLNHVKKAFTNLKKLHLHLVLDNKTCGKRWGAPPEFYHPAGTSISQETHTNATECLIQILKAASGLHTLELAIDLDFFKDVLDGAPSFHSLLHSQTWPALRSVHLRGKTLTRDALLQFIARHCSTVRELTIQNAEFFKDAKWLDVFQSMGQEDLKLDVLHLRIDLDRIYKPAIWSCTDFGSIKNFFHKGPSFGDCLCFNCQSGKNSWLKVNQAYTSDIDL
jgi:hypothetical protein